MNNDMIEKYYDLTDMNALSVAETLAAVRDNLTDVKIHLSSLMVEHPYADDDKPRIALLFYELDEENIENEKDYLASAKEDYISEDKVSTYINEEQLQYAQIFNDPDNLNELSSIPRLLQKVINYLSFHEESRVLDIVYIDQINSDALHVPSIRIYSARKSEHQE